MATYLAWREFGTPPEHRNPVLHLLHEPPMEPTASEQPIGRSRSTKTTATTNSHHLHHLRSSLDIIKPSMRWTARATISISMRDFEQQPFRASSTSDQMAPAPISISSSGNHPDRHPSRSRQRPDPDPNPNHPSIQAAAKARPTRSRLHLIPMAFNVISFRQHPASVRSWQHREIGQRAVDGQILLQSSSRNPSSDHGRWPTFIIMAQW
ncbi:hypothetical protein ACLOJK_036629 [Asimina triloba]